MDTDKRKSSSFFHYKAVYLIEQTVFIPLITLITLTLIISARYALLDLRVEHYLLYLSSIQVATPVIAHRSPHGKASICFCISTLASKYERCVETQTSSIIHSFSLSIIKIVYMGFYYILSTQ